MAFLRKCRPGEEIRLEARTDPARAQDGVMWDARCLDSRGEPILVVRGVRMQWLEG